MTFHVDRHIESFLHDLLRDSHCLDSSVAIPAIDRHQRAHPHRAPQYGIAEQLLLHHHRSAPRNQRNRNRRIQIRHVIRHEDVSAIAVKFVETDSLHSHARQPHPVPRAKHEHAIQQPNVARDERPGKSDESRYGRGQRPEYEHRNGSDHSWFLVAPPSRLSGGRPRSLDGRQGAGATVYCAPSGISASPFNHAVRRARCSAVTFSVSLSSYEISSRLPTFHFSARSAPRLPRIVTAIMSPGISHAI